MKNLLVTGAGNGLGARIAALADDAGYRVGVLDLDINAASAVADNLTNAVPLGADVRDEDEVAAALGEFGTPDVLVNNAGILRTGPLLEQSVEDFRMVVDTNLVSVFVVSQAAARLMRDAGGGAIVNMASINGMHPSLDCGAYPAAKAGVMNMTQQMAIEWGPFGIRVNSIAPGFIDAGMSAPFFENPDIRRMRGNAVPLKRLGSADDVARCALFLASDEASYISGENIAVDGGVINSVLMQLPRE